MAPLLTCAEPGRGENLAGVSILRPLVGQPILTVAAFYAALPVARGALNRIGFRLCERSSSDQSEGPGILSRRTAIA